VRAGLCRPAWRRETIASSCSTNTPTDGGRADRGVEIPVFGSFDRNYRIGALVLSYPWKDVEKLLFSVETGTILLETGASPSVLAADPQTLRDSAAGRLHCRSFGGQDGILGRWQVQALQETRVVTRSLRRVGLELAVLGLASAFRSSGWGLAVQRLTAPVVELTRVVRRSPIPTSSTPGFRFHRPTNCTWRDLQPDDREPGRATASVNSSYATSRRSSRRSRPRSPPERKAGRSGHGPAAADRRHLA